MLLVRAAQRGDLVTAGGLARRLTGNDQHFELVDAALDLGRALKRAGVVPTLGGSSAAADASRLHGSLIARQISCVRTDLPQHFAGVR
ncbi:MAG: hypothetical protein ABSG76_23535 [Xanthobacteraceae bacterium]